jgi:hypothetical protein
MFKSLIKASAIACVLGGFATTVPVYAADDDTETEAVEESMNPDVKAPGPSEKEAMPEGAPATPADEDIGEEEIERDMGKPEEKN